MIRSNRKYIVLLSQVILLIAITLVISDFNLDIKIQRLFYRAYSASVWFHKDNPFWRFGYHYGTLPAILLAFAAALGLILSWLKPKMKSWRRYFLLIILTLIIGPGLLVNAIFKDHWGRPRPRQIQEFGGKWEFKEVWERGTPGKGKSFPCGHCSMGFFFITLYYCFKRKHKALAYSTVTFCIALGMFIGFARISQGGHFLSDVLWAWGLTYLAATILYYFILKIPDYELKLDGRKPTALPLKSSRVRRVLITIAVIVSIGIMIFTFLFSKPFYQESLHEAKADESFQITKLHLDINCGDLFVHHGKFKNLVQIKTTAQGFGFPEYQYESNLIKKLSNDTLTAIYKLSIKGLFNEIDIQTSIEVDASQKIYLSGGTKKGNVFIDEKIPSNVVILNDLSATSNHPENENK